jgi:hypothetical protein
MTTCYDIGNSELKQKLHSMMLKKLWHMDMKGHDCVYTNARLLHLHINYKTLNVHHTSCTERAKVEGRLISIL